jgi:hypothetical protein
MSRLATIMQAFHSASAIASSARLLRRIMATESALLVPFIQSEEFCELPPLVFCLRCVTIGVLRRFAAPQVLKNEHRRA